MCPPLRRLRMPGVVFVALVGVLSCSAPVVRPGPLAEELAPSAVFQLVRRREDGVRSLRARFVAVTSRGGEKRSADGVLVVRKPDRFRLRLFLPLGITILDYVSVGPRARLSLPLQGRVTSGPPGGDYAPFSREDLGEAFLRGWYAFPGRCTARSVAAEVLVSCRASGGAMLRRIRIDPKTATIREETAYADRRPRMTLRYSDYRVVDGTPLPDRIEMSYPDRDMSVRISVTHYELNPKLPDELFAMAPASGS